MVSYNSLDDLTKQKIMWINIVQIRKCYD